MKQTLIDSFIVPEGAVKAFTERMQINRQFIKKLPGFIEDSVYARRDEQQNWVCVTLAVWENEAAIKNARDAVQAEYKKEGFDMPAALKKWGVKFERGVYQKMDF